MGTTIKQLANELGVSKPTISNVIIQLDMQDKLRRVGNRYILTETQIEQIKLYLSEDNEEKIHSQSQKLIKSPKTPNSQNSDDDEEKIRSQSEKLTKSPKTPKSQNSDDDEEEIQSQRQKLIKSPKTSKSQNSDDDEEEIQSQRQKLIKSPKTSKSQNSDDNEEEIHLQRQKLIKSPKTPNSQNDIMQKQLSALYDQLAIKDKQIQMLQEQFLAQGQILQEQLATKDKQIQLLQEQLIAKDNQIGQITVAMENLTASLNAEQALHAGTIQKQLAEHSVMEQSYDTEQPKQKQGFFARLFGKKEN